jgi:hypothetical protein
MKQAIYAGDDLLPGHYLEALERPDGLSDHEYQQLRKKARTFSWATINLFKHRRCASSTSCRTVGATTRDRSVTPTIGVDATQGKMSIQSVDCCQKRVGKAKITSKFIVFLRETTLGSKPLIVIYLHFGHYPVILITR